MRTQANTYLCIENSEYPASLELLKVYRRVKDVVADKQGLIRIVDESGEDYLYPSTWFVPVAIPPRARVILNRASAH